MAATRRRSDDSDARDFKSEAQSAEQPRDVNEEGIEDLEVTGEDVVGGKYQAPNTMAR